MSSSGGAWQISSPTVYTITTNKKTLSCLTKTLELTASTRALFSEQHHTIATNSVHTLRMMGNGCTCREHLCSDPALLLEQMEVSIHFIFHMLRCQASSCEAEVKAVEDHKHRPHCCHIATPQLGPLYSCRVDWQKTDLWVSLTLHCLADGNWKTGWKLTCPIWLTVMNKRWQHVKSEFSASHFICDHLWYGRSHFWCDCSKVGPVRLTPSVPDWIMQFHQWSVKCWKFLHWLLLL